MYSIKEILRMEVAPALGCTEPAAITLCTAAAASLLMDRSNINEIELWVDANIYKNAFAVSIPNTDGLQGIELAAALGAVCGDPSRRLQVLETINNECLSKAQGLLAKERVKVNLLADRHTIYIKSKIVSPFETAIAEITDVHDNIVSLMYKGQEIKDHPLLSQIHKNTHSIKKLEKWLMKLKLKDLIAMIEQLDDEDYDFIRQGIDSNLQLAKYGLTYGNGLGVGMTLKRLAREGLLKRDMVLAARILTSAAADARMAGVSLPAMSSAGSGNHGLTAILPIIAVKDFITYENESQILKAIALSHLITGYIKAHTGRLSAICGCSIAAGAGATGGIVYLMGGNLNHITGAIKNVIGDLAGVICDGAKAGCALKLSTAAGNAVQSALFSLHGLDVKKTDGIIDHSPEQTLKNIGQLSCQGMIETDRTILEIMINKKFHS